MKALLTFLLTILFLGCGYYGLKVECYNITECDINYFCNTEKLAGVCEPVTPPKELKNGLLRSGIQVLKCKCWGSELYKTKKRENPWCKSGYDIGYICKGGCGYSQVRIFKEPAIARQCK